MKVKLLACQSLWREAYLAASRAPHYIDIRLISPEELVKGGLQRAVDEVDQARQDYDAVLLACGLCGGAHEGLVSSRHLLVMPRVHDCMALLLGSRERYRRVFLRHDGELRFVSRGLLETGGCPALGGVKGGTQCCVVSPIPGLNHPCPDADEELAGDFALLEALVSGQWPEEDFVLLSPGSSLTASYTRQMACAR
jgi:hypothetical protein